MATGFRRRSRGRGCCPIDSNWTISCTGPERTCLWGELSGDATAAAAAIDRAVHHGEVVSLKGECYQVKDRDLERVPTDDAKRGGRCP